LNLRCVVKKFIIKLKTAVNAALVIKFIVKLKISVESTLRCQEIHYQIKNSSKRCVGNITKESQTLRIVNATTTPIESTRHAISPIAPAPTDKTPKHYKKLHLPKTIHEKAGPKPLAIIKVHPLVLPITPAQIMPLFPPEVNVAKSNYHHTKTHHRIKIFLGRRLFTYVIMIKVL
jgi:hypothetical protein